MTISSTPTSLLDSVIKAQTDRQEFGVAVLKKAQDTLKQEGEAMVEMLEQTVVSPTDAGKPLFEAYA
jgi:hypothetical protein